MKIIHIINYFQHQIGYQEYFLAKEQAEAGHNVTIISSDRYFPFPDYESTVKSILGNRYIGDKVEFIDGFKIIRLKSVLEKPAQRIWLKGLVKQIIRIKPDLIICHGVYNYNALVTSLLRKFLKFSIIMDSHSHYTDTYKDSKNILSLIMKMCFRYFIWADGNIKFVAVTEQTKEFMIKEHKINGNNINIIPLGTDINRFRPDVVNRLQVRKVLNVPENDTLIIYTGKIVQTKDPALIIEACSDLFYNQNIKLLFVGNVGREYAYRFGKLKEAYQKYIIHIEAVPNSEISKYYQASAIGVWPKEASMSSVDAMSCGLPIIICDYLSERLKNENGIGIKEADLKSLKKALEKLVIDKKLCIQMGKNGRMLAEEEYSWKSIAQKFLNLADI